MQETLQEKSTERVIDAKLVRTIEETETGVKEGTIEPGLHSYTCKYTIKRHSYAPYELLVEKSYGSYHKELKGGSYGNHR